MHMFEIATKKKRATFFLGVGGVLQQG